MLYDTEILLIINKQIESYIHSINPHLQSFDWVPNAGKTCHNLSFVSFSYRAMSSLSLSIPATFPSAFSLQTRDDEDPFYTGCHITKNCFGSPAGCIKTKNCDAAVAVIVQGDQYLFEMQAQESRYVAVGLSDDKNMVIVKYTKVSQVSSFLFFADGFSMRIYAGTSVREISH